jgi:uncharacterized repeat protein (TIGR01451 family)/CSLREA domain-containing protein
MKFISKTQTHEKYLAIVVAFLLIMLIAVIAFDWNYKKTHEAVRSFIHEFDIKKVFAATLTVNSLLDTGDDNPGDGVCDDGAGNCTLRAAIEEANALFGLDTINFSVGSGLITFTPTSALPTITESVIIDGTSQPGYAGTPIVEIDGTGAGLTVNGLRFDDGENTIQGLVIRNFTAAGILLNTGDGSIITRNYIGTNAAGDTVMGNGTHGIDVRTANNTIGGHLISGEHNIISGNGSAGVQIAGTSATGNSVSGNYIGIAADGESALPNDEGVYINNASGTIVGGTLVPNRNVISGNTAFGVHLAGGASSNTVMGNYIGTDVTGLLDVGNGADGVTLLSGNSNNIIGGTIGTTPGGACTGACNVISGNGANGIVMNSNNTFNDVRGNFIGVDVTGTGELGNDANGVWMLHSSSNNTIGNGTAAGRNIISGNGGQGITTFNNANNQTIVGNYIGTDTTGAAAIPNSNGVEFLTSGHTVGGTAAGQRNIISGNTNRGIVMSGSGASAISIIGNFIGTNASGAAGLGNGIDGIYVLGGSNITIGDSTGVSPSGACTGGCNLISGNTSNGIHFSTGSNNNMVIANRIGLNNAGDAAIANAHGIAFSGAEASNNTIGGDTAEERNVISGNQNNGIYTQSGANENIISGNYIGTNILGDAAVENEAVGVALGSNDNRVGGLIAGERNVISGNSTGITIGFGSNNDIVGNYIGVSADGASGIGNPVAGVEVGISANNTTIGGSTISARNIISGNGDYGIFVYNFTSNTVIQGNYIGTNATGSASISNIRGVGVLNGAGQVSIIGITGVPQVISGNSNQGIQLLGADEAVIRGNRIGTNAAGDGALGNGKGIELDDGANDNTIGGTGAGQGNTISGNLAEGMSIVDGSGNSILGNKIGTNASGEVALANATHGISVFSSNNIIGGATASARNLISGNTLSGVRINGASATGNTVQGNYIGTDHTGTDPIGNDVGVDIQEASQNLVGGVGQGQGNLISGNDQHGVMITDGTSQENVIQGNLIGTDKDGISAVKNGGSGVLLDIEASENLIGGSVAGARNVISGNGNFGIFIDDNCFACTTVMTNNDILGNYIGTDITGEGQIGNELAGVFIDGGMSGNNIGDTGELNKNIIAFNGEEGIRIEKTASIQNKISANSIHSNGGLGIDLGNDGPTANDTGDADTGPNNLQNYPVIQLVTKGSTKIQGSFNSESNKTYTLQFFANTVCDDSGFGEGERYIGQTQVSTDGSGNASFTATFEEEVAPGTFITATATDPLGNTSEFSACNNSTQIALADLSINKTVDMTSANVGDIITYTITATNHGPDIATNVSLVEELPNGLLIVESSTTQGTFNEQTRIWSIGELATSTTVTLTIRAQITSEANGEALINITTITADQYDPNPDNNTRMSGSATVTVNAPLIITAPGFGGGSHIRGFDRHGNPVPEINFFAYGKEFRGGAYVATGDVDKDGSAEIIIGPGQGATQGPRIRVIEQTGQPRGIEFFPFHPDFDGGTQVASGDVNGDGKDEVAMCKAISGDQSWCKVYKYNDPKTILAYWKVFGVPELGASIAMGDIDGDGKDEVIIGAGPGGGPHIKVFDVVGTKNVSGPEQGVVLKPIQIFPFHPKSRSGINVAVGDVDGDGKVEIGACPQTGEIARCKIYRYNEHKHIISDFKVFDDHIKTGAFITMGDIDRDGLADIIVGPADGGGPQIRAFKADGTPLPLNFFAYDEHFRGGVRPAYGRF